MGIGLNDLYDRSGIVPSVVSWAESPAAPADKAAAVKRIRSLAFSSLALLVSCLARGTARTVRSFCVPVGRSPASPSIRSFEKFISRPGNGNQMPGLSRIVLDLLPQIMDEGIDGPRRRKMFVAPDLIEDAVPIDDFAFPADEQFQEIILLSRQVDLAIAFSRRMLLEIDGDVAESEAPQYRDPGRPRRKTAWMRARSSRGPNGLVT